MAGTQETPFDCQQIAAQTVGESDVVVDMMGQPFFEGGLF